MAEGGAWHLSTRNAQAKSIITRGEYLLKLATRADTYNHAAALKGGSNTI
tara:strand:+ start:424 stop:573 length:150 start_codon:yes stop_codon:yes gene_type:complete